MQLGVHRLSRPSMSRTSQSQRRWSAVVGSRSSASTGAPSPSVFPAGWLKVECLPSVGTYPRWSPCLLHVYPHWLYYISILLLYYHDQISLIYIYCDIIIIIKRCIMITDIMTIILFLQKNTASPGGLLRVAAWRKPWKFGCPRWVIADIAGIYSIILVRTRSINLEVIYIYIISVNIYKWVLNIYKMWLLVGDFLLPCRVTGG